MLELPGGELLRVDGSLGNDRRVRCGWLLGRRGERVLELRGGHIPSEQRAGELLELRGGPVPSEQRPDELRELRGGELLRGDGSVGGDGCVPVGGLFGWRGERVYKLRGRNVPVKHGFIKLRRVRHR